MSADPAILAALDVFKQPAKARSLHRRELPPDMLTVIKIAAGDMEATETWKQFSGESGVVLKEAAAFYLQQTIAKAGQDNFRTLGLRVDASKEDIRVHKRWLLKWLHPDRNQSKWETQLFHRVTAATQSLEIGPVPGAAMQLVNQATTLGQATARHSRYQRKDTKMWAPARKFSWKTVLQKLLLKGVVVSAVLSAIWVFANWFMEISRQPLSLQDLGL